MKRAHLKSSRTPSRHVAPNSVARHKRFSEILEQLLKQFGDRPVQVREILEATKGRGFHLLLVLIALPFVTPVPLPGVSIPFGVAVALIGGRMAMGRKPWLPERILNHRLPNRFLSKLLASTTRVIRWAEFLLRPRLMFLHEHVVFRRLAGVLIALSGLFLILPFPIPFSNSLPAWTVLLIAAGALERDGVFFVGGCVMFLVTSVYFTLLATGASHLLVKLKAYLPF